MRRLTHFWFLSCIQKFTCLAVSSWFVGSCHTGCEPFAGALNNPSERISGSCTDLDTCQVAAKPTALDHSCWKNNKSVLGKEPFVIACPVFFLQCSLATTPNLEMPKTISFSPLSHFPFITDHCAP